MGTTGTTGATHPTDMTDMVTFTVPTIVVIIGQHTERIGIKGTTDTVSMVTIETGTENGKLTIMTVNVIVDCQKTPVLTVMWTVGAGQNCLPHLRGYPHHLTTISAPSGDDCYLEPGVASLSCGAISGEVWRSGCDATGSVQRQRNSAWSGRFRRPMLMGGPRGVQQVRVMNWAQMGEGSEDDHLHPVSKVNTCFIAPTISKLGVSQRNRCQGWLVL